VVDWSQRRPQTRPRRQRPRRRGVTLVVIGCVLFGAGVLVGAFLGPLARPKTAASPPTRPPTKASAPSSKSKASKRPPPKRSPAAGEKLTFFKTLKESSPVPERTFVPFKPAGEAPPPLETMVPKKPVQEARQKPPPSPKAPSSTPTERRRYYVRVAAFQFKENARRLTWELRQEGYQAFGRTTRSARKPYQVRVGPYTSWPEASAVARRLKKRLLYPTAVVSEKGSRAAVSPKNTD
jgi:cell division protein FtsN